MSKEMLAWSDAGLNAAAVARSNLQRNKKAANFLERKSTILSALQVRLNSMSTEPKACFFAQDCELSVVAQVALVWLEHLGNAFSMPLEGHVMRTYTRVGDFVVAILNHANVAAVIETFERTLEDLLKIARQNKLNVMCDYISLEKVMMVTQLRMRKDIGSVERSAMANFWKALAGDAGPGLKPSARDCAAALRSWLSAWSCHEDTSAWESRRLERRDICQKLVTCADLLQMLAEAFVCCSGSEEEWLNLEQQRLQRLYVAQNEERNAQGQSQLQLARIDINEDSEVVLDAGLVPAASEPIDAEKVELKRQLDELKVALETENEEKLQLQEQVVVLKVGVERDHAEIAELRKQVERDDAEKVELGNQVAHLKTEVETYNGEKVELRRKVAQLKAAVEKNYVELNLKNEVTVAELKLKNEVIVAELKVAMKRVDGEKMELGIQVAELKVALKRVDREKMELEKLVAEFQAAMEKNYAEKGVLRKQVAELKAALAKERAAATAKQQPQMNADGCVICKSKVRHLVSWPCGHGQFCVYCLLWNNLAHTTCPTCRMDMHFNLLDYARYG